MALSRAAICEHKSILDSPLSCFVQEQSQTLLHRINADLLLDWFVKCHFDRLFSYHTTFTKPEPELRPRHTIKICKYAWYRYAGGCHHNLGHGANGGRPFRFETCDEHKNTPDGKPDEYARLYKDGNRTYNLAEPYEECTKHTIEVLTVPTVCHKCDRARAMEAGYPLNRNYPLVVGMFLSWDIPYRQAKQNFEGCNFATFPFAPSDDKTQDDHLPSPKTKSMYGFPSTSTNTALSGASTAIDHSDVSPISLERSKFPLSPAQRQRSASAPPPRTTPDATPEATLEVSPSSREASVAGPTPLYIHPGDTFFDHY